MDAIGSEISFRPSLMPLLSRLTTPSSDSQSEISSIGSEISDVKGIAFQLGIDPEDLCNERFKVDRQKLENMIRVESLCGNANGAEDFFKAVMEATGTHISWPCRLKIGAKSKKDPHVRILGTKDNVTNAKDKVLAKLDSRGTRVIMKMDISYTDHSYIIGRGGNNIKGIMERTSTHIHFPDSNRSNSTEKSNQVSLCGGLDGVEQARSLIRLTAPLIFSFELPIMIAGRPAPDNDTQYVKDIEEKFSVQVIFSSRSKLHLSLVLVKGSEQEATSVREATQLLINFMCENLAHQTDVNLQLEISPQHHEFVRGADNRQLLSIMERTKTKIIFPDVRDVNTKPIKKSQVTISGSIDGVYNARQQLIGNLPVALIFDYPESDIKPDQIAMLNAKHCVCIAPRHKSRQSTLCIVIKGVEKFVDQVYEARHELLSLSTPLVKPNIPATYFASKDQIADYACRKNATAHLATFPESPLTPGAGIIPNFESMTPSFNQYQGLNNNQLNMNMQLKGATLNRYNVQQHQQMHLNQGNGQAKQYLNSSQTTPRKSNISGYHSFSSNATSMEQLCGSFQTVLSSPSSRFSPEMTSSSPVSMTRRLNDSGVGSQLFESEPRTPIPPPGMYSNPFLCGYDAKRAEGYKAMKRPPQGELRTPTPAWAGLSLSKSSPLALEPSGISQWNYREEHSPYKFGATTGLLDTTYPGNRQPLSEFKDIQSLLVHLQLDHYINNFVVHEIDIDVFCTLTAEDLVGLGISAFGSRKKMLFAIKQLNSERATARPSFGRFFGSAAPGAERRPSTGW